MDERNPAQIQKELADQFIAMKGSKQVIGEKYHTVYEICTKVFKLNNDLLDQNDETVKTLDETAKKVKELEARLARYENSFVPSSHLLVGQKEAQLCKKDAENNPNGKASNKNNKEGGKNNPNGKASNKNNKEGGKNNPNGKASNKNNKEGGKNNPNGKASNKNNKEGGKNNPNGKASNKNNKDKSSSENNNQDTKQQGGQPGHTGTTGMAVPDETKTVVAKQCPDCEDSNLIVTSKSIKVIKDIKKHPEAITTAYETAICECLACGLKNIRPEDDPSWGKPACLGGIPPRKQTDKVLPSGLDVASIPACLGGIPPRKQTDKVLPSGLDVASTSTHASEESKSTDAKKFTYGKNIRAEIGILFMNRLTFRLIRRYMGRFALHLSDGAIYNIVKKLGMNMNSMTDEIIAKLIEAEVLNIDETSISYNGKKVWIWVFHDPETGNTAFVIRESRGKDVIKETLKDWNGLIVCDGWTSYISYDIQRCWAHLITEARSHVRKNPNCPEAHYLHKKLKKIYHAGVTATGTVEQREKIRDKLRKRFKRLTDKYPDHPILESFINKLNNAYPNLFRFVVDPNIPGTNNTAERALREIIVHRKIRGCIRSADTFVWLANLFTCITTWKFQGKDEFAELAAYV